MLTALVICFSSCRNLFYQRYFITSVLTHPSTLNLECTLPMGFFTEIPVNEDVLVID